MTRDESDLMSHFEGRFDDMIMFGPVSDGIRMDGHFSGPITAGALSGAHLTGVDYFRIRPDGVGVIDAREVITLDGQLISVQVYGYLLAPPEVQVSVAEVTRPGFEWPDAPFAVRAAAWFQTAAPDLAELNSTVVTHIGTVNLATGALGIDARRVAAAPAGSTSELAGAAPGIA